MLDLRTLNITAAQRMTLQTQVAEGFQVVEVSDVVRISKHGDNRLVKPDGAILRAQHQVRRHR